MNRPRWKYAALTGLAVGTTALLSSAAASAVVAHYAKRVVTPDRVRTPNAHVRSVGTDTITVARTPESLLDGLCGLFLDDGATHVRVGNIVADKPAEKAVVRELIGVDYGAVKPGPGRWNSYYLSGNPRSACDIDYTDITLTSSAGSLPAWYVPRGTADETDSGESVFALCIHGRGATREETLRALPVLHRLGISAIVPSYRNSAEGPVSGRGSYHLGQTEWEDIEAALVAARELGATKIVMIGWSMGAAIALQTMARSWAADRVRAVILDSPVLDWAHTLNHHARANKLPQAIGAMSLRLLSTDKLHGVTGTDSPLDFGGMDWVARADELRVPTMVMHSAADQTVPYGPTVALAAKRPDLVTFHEFADAGHVREWNTDPDRWEREVARFILTHV